MAGDELVASGQVRGGDDRVDLFERHVQGRNRRMTWAVGIWSVV